MDAYGYDSSKAIYLYTTPLKNQRHIFHKPRDILAHWAICIQGRCYELKRATPQTKGDPKYGVRSTPELEWTRKKEDVEHRVCKKTFAGNMYVAYPRRTIERVCEYSSSICVASSAFRCIHLTHWCGTAELVWQKSLRNKYIYDEHNCQVFARLLVELIGDPETKVRFPQFFDVWLKRSGIIRDVSFMTAAVGGSLLAAASVGSVAIDPSGTTALAGVALSTSMVVRSSTALMSARYLKEKDIEKGQSEIKKILELEGIRLG